MKLFKKWRGSENDPKLKSSHDLKIPRTTFRGPKCQNGTFFRPGPRGTPQNRGFRIPHPASIYVIFHEFFTDHFFRHFLDSFFRRARKWHFSADVFWPIFYTFHFDQPRFLTYCTVDACCTNCFHFLEMPCNIILQQNVIFVHDFLRPQKCKIPEKMTKNLVQKMTFFTKIPNMRFFKFNAHPRLYWK
jgi:hypothetical protein